MAQKVGLHNLFAQDADLDLDLNLIAEETFTNDKFKDAHTFDVPNNIETGTLQLFANQLHTQLTTGVLTQNTPKVALVLAIYLDGRDKLSNPLLASKPTGGTLLVTAELTDNQQRVLPPVQRGGVLITNENESDNEYLVRVLANQALHEEQGNVNPFGVNVSLRYMKFLSAYSLRLIVKSAQNMMASKQKMDAAFAKMYTENSEPNVVIAEATWERFKTMISGIPRLINTWVRCIAEYESTAAQDSEDAGMIRYLANLPLSFAGMHAYSLFLEVMRKTGKDMRWLLTEMRTSPTKDALVQIMEIDREFERKKGTDQRLPTYYRYARIISPKYFTRIQTKNSLSLVYLETKILRHYIDFGDQGPDKIMALAPLGKGQREFLDAHAREIIAKITADGDVFAS